MCALVCPAFPRPEYIVVSAQAKRVSTLYSARKKLCVIAPSPRRPTSPPLRCSTNFHWLARPVAGWSGLVQSGPPPGTSPPFETGAEGTTPPSTFPFLYSTPFQTPKDIGSAEGPSCLLTLVGERVRVGARVPVVPLSSASAGLQLAACQPGALAFYRAVQCVLLVSHVHSD